MAAGTQNQVLIIAGMHRSGTSMVSSYLEACGLALGGNLLKADENNPKGYFEDTDFLHLQKKILTKATENGQDGWPDWGFTEDSCFNEAVVKEFHTEAKELVKSKQNENRGLWGWKDPRTTILLGLWEDIIPDAKYVLIYRNPWEVKNSIQQLGASVFDKNPDYAYKIWMFYNEHLLSFYQKHKEKCLLISANGFLIKPELLIEHINSKFNWKLSKSESDNFYSSKLFNSKNAHGFLNEFINNNTLKEQLKHLDILADIQGQQTPLDCNKRVSVVIPCFNHGQYLLDAIDSVKRSLFDNYEIIIVNDGSDDPNTLEILQGLKNEGVNVIHQKNKGLAKARNTGIKQAKHEYILPLDSDNRIEPDYISMAIEILNNNDKIGVVYSDVKVFGEHSELRRLPDLQIDRFLAVNYIDACAVFRKEIWKKLGGYDEQHPIAGYEDWEFWISIFKAGWQFYHIDKFLFDYRVREGSMVAETNKAENRRTIVEYIVKKHYELYKENSEKVIGYLTKNLSEIELIHFKQAEHILKQDKHILKQDESILKQEENVGQLNLLLSEKNSENLSLNNSLDIQKNYNVSLNSVIRFMEDKVRDIESSKLWKLKRKYHKLKTLFRSSHDGISQKGLIRKAIYFLTSNGRKMLRKVASKIFKNIYLLIEEKQVTIIEGDAIPAELHGDPWQNFLARTTPSSADLKEYGNHIKIFSYKPKISIIMPVYNVPEAFLIQAIESVIDQVYGNWELCIADDCSTNEGVRKILEKFCSEDARIKVVFREKNGHVSIASNSALELATGEFISLLDHDDLLSKDAIYQLVYTLNVNRSIDFIYSDEDKIDENGTRTEPHFKPDWCPDNFMARNYITHLACLRKSIVDEIGGFRVGFEGSQDYDLFLRFIEKSENIYHIPKILYHWRMHSESTAMEESAKPYAFEAGVKALSETLERKGEKGTVELKPGLPGFYTVRYEIESEDMVSIVIPTKNKADVLETCLKSVFEKSSYKNFEVVLVNNGSTEKSLFGLLDKYEKKYPGRFIRLDLEIPFNFSRLMNKAVEKAKGKYILLLNNDTEIITEDWIESMIEQAQRNSVGAVGVKLLYHNDTIQHAGVVIGLGGVAGHTFIGLPRFSHGYFYYISSTNNYSAVTAACLMVRKDVYLEVGGFNEELSVEYNDVDFCLKLVEKGYNNIYLPYVEVYHYESLTRGHPHMTKESYERHIKEIDFFKSKWGSFIGHDPCYNQNLTLDATHFQIRN